MLRTCDIGTSSRQAKGLSWLLQSGNEKEKRKLREKKQGLFLLSCISYGNHKLGLLMNFFSEETGTTEVKLIPKDRMLTAESNQELPFSSPLDTIAL